MVTTTNSINIATDGKGLYEITDQVAAIVRKAALEEGLCTVFLQHTSAGLLIQENADPTARNDLEEWLERHVPENDPNYTHTTEGSDDMPAHIRAALTGCSLSIPIARGGLVLGTWQGIYLWEHRRAAHKRRVVVSLLS